ncbi:MAG: ATP-binding cassette domain-containing protein [Ectothiorhodospiraceae bacterium]|nr:ATP-binding cassette domain-containing protein [Ectothiorhodospiraceae bacterium]
MGTNATARAPSGEAAARLVDSPSAAPEVAVEDLRFAWRRGAPDVLVIDRFTVRRGERVFLAGPSGSGKSTLLGLLGGVLVPRAGAVRIHGVELSALPGARRDRFRADHIGFVFQMFNLVPYLSMGDNVTLPCAFSARRRDRATARSGSVRDDAARLLDHLELDRATLAARPVTELSIGQQQRVAVARALIGSPEVLIADEPTSALDAGTRERFLDLLFTECTATGTTVIFVSHEAALGTAFDRVVALAELQSPSGPR